eukprot:gene46783-31390_t
MAATQPEHPLYPLFLQFLRTVDVYPLFLQFLRTVDVYPLFL